MKQPLIFDIKRYAINDGPGIRITIFFKGCPLLCKWCHNPESHLSGIQKFYTSSKCIGAKDCIIVCPNNALKLTPQGVITDYELCKLCGKCAEACPTKAIEMVGQKYSISSLLKIIKREKVHIDHSGGGVTFSGGEPLIYSEFLIEILKECGKLNIHRTIDTSGYVDTNVLLEVARHVELFLYDLKLMDPIKHKNWTGVGNELILKNLKVLTEIGAKINIRIPLIKNVNSDENNLRAMAEFISNLSEKTPKVNYLPYHKIATNKYIKLGSSYNELTMETPSNDEKNRAVEIFKEYDVDAEVN